MDEQRKYAILFAATILAARKLNDSGNTPWALHVAITDAIEKANRILEKIDERWTDFAGRHLTPPTLPKARNQSSKNLRIAGGTLNFMTYWVTVAEAAEMIINPH